MQHITKLILVFGRQRLKISIGPIQGEANGGLAVFALCLVLLGTAVFLFEAGNCVGSGASFI